MRRRRSIYHHNSSSRKEEATLDVRPSVRPRVPSRPQSAAAGRRRILRAKSRSNAIGVLFAHFKKSSESDGLAHTVERELRRPSMLPTTAVEDKFCKYAKPLKYHMRVVRLQVAGATLRFPPSLSSPSARRHCAAIYVPRDLTVTICFFNGGRRRCGRRRRRVRPRRPSSLSRSLRPPPPPLFAAF